MTEPRGGLTLPTKGSGVDYDKAGYSQSMAGSPGNTFSGSAMPDSGTSGLGSSANGISAAGMGQAHGAGGGRGSGPGLSLRLKF